MQIEEEEDEHEREELHDAEEDEEEEEEESGKKRIKVIRALSAILKLFELDEFPHFGSSSSLLIQKRVPKAMKENEEAPSLLQLPPETLSSILYHLDPSSLLNIARTCKQLCLLASNDDLWKPFIVYMLISMRKSPFGEWKFQLHPNFHSWKEAALKVGLKQQLSTEDIIRKIFQKRKEALDLLSGMLITVSNDEKSYELKSVLWEENKVVLKDEKGNEIIVAPSVCEFPPLSKDCRVKIVGRSQPDWLGKTGKLLNVSYSCGYDTTAALVKLDDQVLLIVPITEVIQVK